MNKLKTREPDVLDMVWDSNREMYTTLADRDANTQREIQAYSGSGATKPLINVSTIITLAPVAAVVYFASPLPLLIYVAVLLGKVAGSSRQDLGPDAPCRRRKGRTNLPLADCRPGAKGQTWDCNR